MIDRATQEQAFAAHYRMQRAMYMPIHRPLPGMGDYCGGPLLEPEWNHVVWSVGEAMDAANESLRQPFAHIDHEPTLVVPPWRATAERARRLTAAGWRQSFAHDWLLASDTGGSPPLPAGSRLEPVADESFLSRYLAVFERVYASADNPDGLPEYRDAIRRSSTLEHPGIEVVHLLVTSADEPVAIGTTILAGDCAGLYNLAVVPSARGLGLGRAVTAHRIELARERGARVVFLQTERASVRDWQRRHGFTLGFTVTGWSLSGSSESRR